MALFHIINQFIALIQCAPCGLASETDSACTANPAHPDLELPVYPRSTASVVEPEIPFHFCNIYFNFVFHVLFLCNVLFRG